MGAPLSWWISSLKHDSQPMTGLVKPPIKPARPYFSSGPCAKPPGWSPDRLAGALLGRSHRSTNGRAVLSNLIASLRRLLELPPDYRLAIVPGSDTGAFEMAMWSLIGARGVDVFAWDVFGRLWVRDVLDELKLEDVAVHEAPFGSLPDLSARKFRARYHLHGERHHVRRARSQL